MQAAAAAVAAEEWMDDMRARHAVLLEADALHDADAEVLPPRDDEADDVWVPQLEAAFDFRVMVADQDGHDGMRADLELEIRDDAHLIAEVVVRDRCEWREAAEAVERERCERKVSHALGMHGSHLKAARSAMRWTITRLQNLGSQGPLWPLALCPDRCCAPATASGRITDQQGRGAHLRRPHVQLQLQLTGASSVSSVNIRLLR